MMKIKDLQNRCGDLRGCFEVAPILIAQINAPAISLKSPRKTPRSPHLSVTGTYELHTPA
jgi:hypothetical protein